MYSVVSIVSSIDYPKMVYPAVGLIWRGNRYDKGGYLCVVRSIIIGTYNRAYYGK